MRADIEIPSADATRAHPSPPVAHRPVHVVWQNGEGLTEPVEILQLEEEGISRTRARIRFKNEVIVAVEPTDEAASHVVTCGFTNCHLHWLMLGGTDFPSLVDMIQNHPEEMVSRALENARATVKLGVTSAIDKGGPTDNTRYVFDALEAARQSGIPLPRTPYTPSMLVVPTSFAGAFCRQVQGEDDVVRLAESIRQEGGQLMKVIPEADWHATEPHYPLTFTPGLFRRCREEARRLGLFFAVHAKGLDTIRQGIELESDCLEHILEAGQEELEAMEAAGIFTSLTLDGLACRLEWAETHQRRLDISHYEWNRANHVGSMAAALNHGKGFSHLLFGSDAGSFNTPHASLRELYLLRRCGFSAEAVFRSAITNPARFLRQTDRLGRIAAGYYMDAIFWSCNPLELAIEEWMNLEQYIAGVVAGGQMVSES